MKNKLFALGSAMMMLMMSCGNQGNDNDNRSDSINANDESNVPPMPDDTANRINSSAGYYRSDSSNMNGDDSVKGTPSSSRRTTPGNEKGDKRKQ